MTETLDIQVVIDGCIANNRKAQEYLYRQYYSYAMVIAQRYSRDDADAADIVSQAFVKVFKSIKSFNSSIASFQTWLRRIVINEGLDHIKARSKFSQEMELEYETVAAEAEKKGLNIVAYGKHASARFRLLEYAEGKATVALAVATFIEEPLLAKVAVWLCAGRLAAVSVFVSEPPA